MGYSRHQKWCERAGEPSWGPVLEEDGDSLESFGRDWDASWRKGAALSEKPGDGTDDAHSQIALIKHTAPAKAVIKSPANGLARSFFNSLVKSASKVRRLQTLQGNYLDELPSKVIRQIGDYLFPVDRAAIAFTSKRHLKLLGHESLRLESGDGVERGDIHSDLRYAFLQRLERDGVYLADVLCPVCRLFHPPRMRTSFTQAEAPLIHSREAYRLCAEGNKRRDHAAQYMSSPHLPLYATFDAVSAILRSSRFPPNYYHYGKMESLLMYRGTSGAARITVHAAALPGADGRLYLKTQHFLFAGPRRWDCLPSVPQLLAVMEAFPKVGSCCAHVRWADFHKFILAPDLSDGARPYATSSSRKHRCLWTHGRRCMDGNGPCGREMSSDLDCIRTCASCCTDYAVSVVDKKRSNATVVVLTSWKDLGRGMALGDTCWRSHLVRATAGGRVCKGGSAYRGYEVAAGRYSAGTVYVPAIQDWMLKDFSI